MNRGFLNKPGAVLLSRGLPLSTIAAEELNGRVRNGNGCVFLAMDTGKFWSVIQTQKSNNKYCLSYTNTWLEMLVPTGPAEAEPIGPTK